MTFEEFLILAKAMRAVYGDKFLSNADALRVWYELLRDLPYDVANAAVQKHMIACRFAPTIAEIREQAFSLSADRPKDSGQAWQEVRSAVRKYGYYRAQEALDTMDPITREAAERFGFQDLCDMDIDEQNVARAQFRKIYDQIAARKIEAMKLPAHVADRLAQLQQNMIEEKRA